MQRFRMTIAYDGTAFHGWQKQKAPPSAPDTEPPRATRNDAIAAKRNEILELIRRGRQGAVAARNADQAQQPSDFVEDQGGIY